MQASSTKSYDLAAEQQLQEDKLHRAKTRKRVIIISISAIALIGIIAAAVVGTHRFPKLTGKPENSSSVGDSIKEICNVTQYSESCASTISSLKISSHDTKSDPQELFKLSLQVALNELVRISSLPKMLMASPVFSSNATSKDPLVQQSLENCETLIEDAIDSVKESISSLYEDSSDRPLVLSNSSVYDIRTSLSAAITFQETCVDGLVEAANHTTLPQQARDAMRNSTEYTSNSLAIATNFLNILQNFKNPLHHRKLLQVDDHDRDQVEFPGRFARILEEEEKPKSNLTVAKDGSGDFRTISEAVSKIPKKSKSARFVIYVKQGVYVENVMIAKDCWNVTMYGDGMHKTIVSGSLNYVDKTTTFSSGTFIVEGRGFAAIDMGFKNTAGPVKEQAVALRSSVDSVFYRCSFDAYQDTLYTHAYRQFYRDCQIVGTIDFIFGDAAVVFQNCTIQPRQPLPKQYNTITASGKTDKNEITGISIQNCRLTPFDNLTAPTFLGRPWKHLARTVIMESYIGGFLNPEGWAPWKPDVVPPSTIFYGEYKNIGPGSAVDGRVKWPGVWPNMTQEQASKFTVESLVLETQWLKKVNVPFHGSL